MAGHEAPQRVLLAEQQQGGQPHAADLAVGLDHAERLGDVQVAQLEQGLVTAPAPLAHAAPEALELQRVEVFPARGGHDRSGGVQQAPVGL